MSKLHTALLLLAATCLVLRLSSGADSFDPYRGLVAHYTFNACDARDDSGQGSHGTLLGRTGCYCGVEGQGLLFDGGSGRLEFSGKVNQCFSTTDFSLSFYIRPLQYSPHPQSLFSKRFLCNDEHLLDLQYDWENREIVTEFRENSYIAYNGLDTPAEAGPWIHFALVREGQRAYTYINGEPRRESLRCSGVDIGNGTPFSFSSSPCLSTGYVQGFRGILDEVRVYHRALSNLEVRQLYLLHPVEHAETDCYALSY
jgi:hypothetical protein